MPGNVNRNAGSNRYSNCGNQSDFIVPLGHSTPRNSVPNFRGSRRVSHRRPQYNNADQRSKVQVSQDVFVNRQSEVATNDYRSNVIPKETTRISDLREVKLSGQNGQKTGSNTWMEIIVSNFSNLRIENGRKPETNTKVPSYPQDFRDLDLYPTRDDINRSGLPFLEPNKIIGAYTNVNHYLNVQFRLIREDFVGSVRKGVQDYQNSANKSKFKYEGIRIYPRTQFERVQGTKNNKLGVLVNFDPECRMRNFKWKESKRFMYGSLLLFTVTDFRNFFYCTVVERDIDALKAGKILVSLPEGVSTDSSFFKRSYLMAECEAFFDPYYLVMKLLREFNESTFPMTRYIVQGAVDSKNPKYLSDFGVLWVSDRIIAPITFDENQWPTCDQMQLDQYQYRALRAALTRDFCVIQGPPGTGKTFIGLKIVQNIWTNAKKFNPKLKLPILVVCSANHAVDQFLEGVLKFTKNVVRVGGQSRSEVMKKYNLRERARSEIKFVSDKHLRGKIWSFQREIDRIGQLMKCAENPSGILSAQVLYDVVGPEHKYLVKDNRNLIEWLLPSERLGKRYDDADFQKFKLENGTRKVVPAKKPEDDQIEEDEDDFDDEEEEPSNPGQKTSYEVDDRGCYSISLKELSVKCLASIDRYEQLRKQESSLKGTSTFNQNTFYNRVILCEKEIAGSMKLFDNLKDRLNSPVLCVARCENEQLFFKDAKSLEYDQRWLIYWQWTLKLVAVLSKELKKLKTSHSENVQLLEDFRQQQDLAMMQKADVVGMTTSGAARLNKLLKSLHPAVVVVEEAGEVLETHVVASLTSECQHVILIGDHEQLRPITAVYELSRSYNMNVSLFERLVKNGMDCPVLNVQHRMRPEISCLISPLIYKDLKNHDSVRKFESIRGVANDVFFVDHNKFENSMSDNSSKQNEYEARFIMLLAIYLLHQQYDPTQITILTTYAAQKTLLCNLRKQYSVDSRVKCVVVDKYQGEENDIVLLSLVRSNAEGKIGFLDTKNRVCVALSRAKKGFYIIGNMSCLAKKSELWQNIRKTLTENRAIAKHLPLLCRTHGKKMNVASISDFALVESGGCGEVCNQKLHCGHICRSKCHYTSGNHPLVKCYQTVLKKCPNNHESPVRCSEALRSENCRQCASLLLAEKNSLRRRNVGSSYTTLPKHSYSFVPLIPQKRRSIFSRCCLL